MTNIFFKYFLWFAAILLLSSSPSWGKIYQCKNDSGQMEFKDSECDSDDIQVKEFVPQPVNINYGQSSGTGPQPGNLVNNGDFSNQATDWQLLNEDIHWSENQGTQGGGGLLMNAALPPQDGYIHDTKASQCVVLDGSETYALRANLLLEKTPKKRLAHRANIVWFQTLDCTKGGTFGGYIEPKASIGRQFLRTKTLKPTIDAVAAKIELVQKGAYSNQGYIIWDDVYFSGNIASTKNKSASPPTAAKPLIRGNFVKNGDFKNKLLYWNNSSQAEWDAFTSHHSRGSARTTLRSKKSGLGTGVLNQCVLLGQGNRVELGGFVKISRVGSSQAGGGRLRLSWYETGDCTGKYKAGRKHADVETTEGWQHLKVENLTVPTSAKAARVQLIQSISGEGVFILNWDDIYLKPVQ